jgi:hypothetical protein
MVGKCSKNESGERYILKFWQYKMKGRDKLEEPYVNGRKILK